MGRYLDEHGYNPSHPPRVLDMACGSGSFLIEAFDVIDRYVMNLRGQATPISPKSAVVKDAQRNENADLGEAGKVA